MGEVRAGVPQPAAMPLAPPTPALRGAPHPPAQRWAGRWELQAGQGGRGRQEAASQSPALFGGLHSSNKPVSSCLQV